MERVDGGSMMNNRLPFDRRSRSEVTPAQRLPLQNLWRDMTATLPNQLTTLRLALIPPLWLLALLGYPVVVGVMLFAAAFTDVLDRYLARRRGLVTEFGSRFDSIADHLLTASTFAWLLLLRPEFFREQRTLLLVWLGLGAAALLVGWLRFGRVGALHLYSAKVAGLLGYCFAIYLLLFGSYPEPFFHLVIAACLLGSAETLLVHLTRDRVDEHIGSIVLRRPAALVERAQPARTHADEILPPAHHGPRKEVTMNTTAKPGSGN
jgi:cardiolipin synthase (CMP-forming)